MPYIKMKKKSLIFMTCFFIWSSGHRYASWMNLLLVNLSAFSRSIVTSKTWTLLCWTWKLKSEECVFECVFRCDMAYNGSYRVIIWIYWNSQWICWNLQQYSAQYSIPKHQTLENKLILFDLQIITLRDRSQILVGADAKKGGCLKVFDPPNNEALKEMQNFPGKIEFTWFSVCP